VDWSALGRILGWGEPLLDEHVCFMAARTEPVRAQSFDLKVFFTSSRRLRLR
jgi:hypothetical protein